jgi:hypothetical protein
MNPDCHVDRDNSQLVTQIDLDAPPTELPEKTTDKILCPHCQRTATNGIKCKGICVADSDY